MSFETQELSQRHLNAIELLLRGLSDTQVGQQIGVDRGTIFRWRRNETFAAEFDRQRQILSRQSVARLQSMIDPALDILQKQISGDDPKTALRAAAILLRVATPARLDRLANPQSRSDSETLEDDKWKAIEAYINAPMPDQPGHPAYERYMAGKKSNEDQALEKKLNEIRSNTNSSK